MRKPAEGDLKLVQITGSNGFLFGLDEDGNVWEYVSIFNKPGRWVMLDMVKKE